jgi:AcrR family transcriptional regulator
MARPPRYTASHLLDAALELAVSGGPAAVTMAAVAKSAEAPSGSVYHRFADRPALLSALWLRTLDGFQQGFLAALAPAAAPGADGGDAFESAVAAARHTVEWSRKHPAEATVLRYGAADFGHDDWPDEARRELRAANRRVHEAVSALARRLGMTGRAPAERVSVAVIDLPYALVHRHLRAGTTVPAHTAGTVEECVRALLAAR